MIVVDSSAFVEFYRPEGNPKVRRAVARAIEDDEVAVNGLIQVEVVAFVRGRGAFDQLAGDFRAFHWLELDREAFELASLLGHELRSKGVTVPATDLIIAASSIRADAKLLHLDRHFDQIARLSDLRARYLG
jgi:predicted nucleic acid-binding protein